MDWALVTQDLTAWGTGFTSIFQNEHAGIKFVHKISSSDSLTFLIKALKKFGDVKILSNPRVSIMNGQPALLTVGRNFSIISKVETKTETSGNIPVINYTVETSNILSGLMIGLVPYIDDDGEISLTITPLVSNILDIAERTFGTFGNQVVLQLPVIDVRQLSTTIRVRDGESIVLGGLIKRESSVKESKTPLLGDLPFVGWLFKQKEDEKVSSELVIILYPRLIEPKEKQVSEKQSSSYNPQRVPMQSDQFDIEKLEENIQER